MLLFTTPRHERPTEYVSRWATQAIEFAKTRKHKVKELKGKHATRTALEAFLKQNTPKLIMFNGHGSPDSVFGHKDEPLVKAGDNESILKSTIIYAVACSSAEILAEASVKAGAIAYIGYKKPFIFTANRNAGNDPLNDERAKPFFISSNQIIISLLKGRSVQQSVQKSKSSFENLSKKMVTSESTTENRFDARMLLWDRKHQIYFGDGEAILS